MRRAKLAIVILTASTLYNAWSAAHWRAVADELIADSMRVVETAEVCERALRLCVHDLVAGRREEALDL